MFQCSNPRGKREVCTIPIVGKPFRICMLLFWVGSSLLNLHKFFESFAALDEENADSSDNNLDYLLIMGESLEEILLRRTIVVFVLQHWGLIINKEKFCLEPKKMMESLGFVMNSKLMTIYLPQEKVGRNNQPSGETPENGTCKYKKDDKPHRSIDFNLSSSITQPIILPVSADETDKEFTGDRNLQNSNNSSLRVLKETDIKKSKLGHGETNMNSNPKFEN